MTSVQMGVLRTAKRSSHEYNHTVDMQKELSEYAKRYVDKVDLKK